MNSVVSEVIRGYYYPQNLSDEMIEDKFNEFVKSGFVSLKSFLYDGGYQLA